MVVVLPGWVCPFRGGFAPTTYKEAHAKSTINVTVTD